MSETQDTPPTSKQASQSPNLSQKSDTDQEGVGGREKGGEGKGEEGGAPQLPEPRLHLLAVLGVLIPHMKFTLPETRMETLRWLMWLHQQLPKRVGLRGIYSCRGRSINGGVCGEEAHIDQCWH